MKRVADSLFAAEGTRARTAKVEALSKALRDVHGEAPTKLPFVARFLTGTMLATDIYLPPSPGPHPVILQRTPYGHTLGHGCFANTSGQMAFWAQNGYVGITQDVRGTFRSHGTFQPFVQ